MGGPGSGCRQWRVMPPTEDVREVIRAVATPLGFSVADVLSKDRSPKLADARAAAMLAVAERWPHLSSSQLGAIFARHHTTILHALGRLSRER